MASLMDLLQGLAQAPSSAGTAIGQGLDNAGSGISSFLGSLKQGFSPEGGSPSGLPSSAPDPVAGVGSNSPSAAPASNVASAPQPTADQILAAGGSASAAPAAKAPTGGNAPLPTQNVDPGKVAPVTASASSPATSDYNADGTQADPSQSASSAQPASGGLLSSLAGAASKAVTDPVKSQGFLSSIGSTLSNVGSKLQSMPPGSAQGFLAAGMATLANNNGHNNLAQLIGMGGTEGLNAFQQVNANRMQMGMNAANIQHQQVADQVSLENAQTEAFKARNPFITVGPGQTVVQPSGGSTGGTAGTGANAQPGAAVIASGGVKAAGSVNQIQPDGSTMTYKTDESGAIIPNTGVLSANPNVGPLPSDRLTVVNKASQQAATDAANLNKTQNLLQQVSSVNIPAGIRAKGANVLTQLTGDQTAAQTVGNMVQTQAAQDMLQTWKAGVGGRLTNTDVQILRSHMPPDSASSQTWSQYLTAVGHLQSDVADQSARGAAFTSQNRGDQGTLGAPLTVGNTIYPKGASYQQVVMGQGGTAAQQSGQNTPNAAQAAPANTALLNEAAKRGFKQNANGQWVAG